MISLYISKSGHYLGTAETIVEAYMKLAKWREENPDLHYFAVWNCNHQLALDTRNY